MKPFLAGLFSLCLIVGGAATADRTPIERANTVSKPEDVRAVAPALEGYAQKYVLGDLWK
jgi:4-carboxymuconolactone decarboxylase